jgi:hypothetical protein
VDYNSFRADDHIVLVVASFRVDSLLLPGGRTAISRIRIPLEIGERTMCNISRGKNSGELVETTMLHLQEDLEAR